MSSRLRDWLDLEGRLRRAVQYRSPAVAVSAEISSAGQSARAASEALLRWCDDEHGDISPIRFVEIAEDSGLIIDMGSWVVRAACRQLRSWMDRGIAVPDRRQRIRARNCCMATRRRSSRRRRPRPVFPPSLIEIEITESLLVKDSATVRSALERLRQLRCRIALDDFGTGYSSLAYITRFPPDRIKIDKAFVHNVDRVGKRRRGRERDSVAGQES